MLCNLLAVPRGRFAATGDGSPSYYRLLIVYTVYRERHVKFGYYRSWMTSSCAIRGWDPEGVRWASRHYSLNLGGCTSGHGRPTWVGGPLTISLLFSIFPKKNDVFGLKTTIFCEFSVIFLEFLGNYLISLEIPWIF